MNNTASVIAPIDEARQEPRTHLFVSATLYWEASSAPINMRNMSPTGALIESPVIPEPDAAVVLRRGSLEVPGRIAWKAGRKAGIAFRHAIHVADWMSRTPRVGQQRVDAIVSDFKAGRQTEGLAANTAAGVNSMAAELESLRKELRELEESLIGDAILVATHPEIQTLDISLQRIDQMIGQLGK